MALRERTYEVLGHLGWFCIVKANKSKEVVVSVELEHPPERALISRIARSNAHHDFDIFIVARARTRARRPERRERARRTSAPHQRMRLAERGSRRESGAQPARGDMGKRQSACAVLVAPRGRGRGQWLRGCEAGGWWLVAAAAGYCRPMALARPHGWWASGGRAGRCGGWRACVLNEAWSCGW